MRSTYHLNMGWGLINAVWFLAPIFLVWGWVQYLRLPDRSTWRSHASVVGLSMPLLSLILGLVDRILAHPVIGPSSFTPAPRLSSVVVWLPIAGTVVSLAGRPRLILPIIWASVGTVLFWYGITLP